jgi:hypothetical protein
MFGFDKDLKRVSLQSRVGQPAPNARHKVARASGFARRPWIEVLQIQLRPEGAKCGPNKRKI